MQNNAIRRAVWCIEMRLGGDGGGDIGLDEVAAAAGLGRFQLARAFQAVAGRPVISYARARRLTEAARALAGGARSILEVALDAGYGSHEAFTRAFRAEFGVTPEAVRAARSTQGLGLQEPFAMTDLPADRLAPPRLERREAFHVAGLSARFGPEGHAAISTLWARFAPWIGAIPGQAGPDAYGVCHDGDGQGAFDYLAGVETTRPDDLPAELARVCVPAGRYAVFTHRGHVADIRETMGAIFGGGLARHGLTHAEGPDFERYGPAFDPRSGTGEIEIWIPVR